MKEFARARRNRATVAGLVFALGLVLVIIPDLEAGSLRLGSVMFLVAFIAGYYRFVPGEREAREDVESFQAVFQALQQAKHGSKSLPRLFGYHLAPGGWMIKRSLLTFDFFLTSDICWVYGKNTRHYVNFIPAGTEHEIVARLRSGKSLKEGYRRKTRDERPGLLRRVAPWAAFGYSEQIEKAWRDDRAAFAAEVDRRRNLLLAGGLERQAT